jgi:hypothetical protein
MTVTPGKFPLMIPQNSRNEQKTVANDRKIQTWKQSVLFLSNFHCHRTTSPNLDKVRHIPRTTKKNLNAHLKQPFDPIFVFLFVAIEEISKLNI